MITKYNSLYDDLFARASIDLGITIESLDDYFEHLEELVAIDEKYMMLPLDEEPFMIDANTRIITVPAQFKNGVGVTGDHIAEIIYFAIDRYYDNTDLATVDKRIEYSNAKGDKWVVKNFYPDGNQKYFIDERYPDKILFGWALSKQATEASGTIEFAVRFYLTNDEKGLDFSFSTLPTKILINKTLNFDMDISEEPDYSDAVRRRFKGAGGEVSNLWPAKPVWIKDLAQGVYERFAEVGVEAGTSDNGVISYEWYKDDVKLESEYVYTKIENLEERDNNKIYYSFTEDNGYEPYLGLIPIEIELFERLSVCKLEDYGKYKVIAINTLNKRTSKISDEAEVIEKPTKPDYTTNGPECVIENGTFTLTATVDKSSVNGNLWYAWDGGEHIALSNTENVISKVVTEDGKYNLVIANTLNGFTETTDAIEFKVITAPKISVSKSGNILTAEIESPKDTYDYTYQWQHKTSSWENIDGATDKNYTVLEEDYYRVIVIANHKEFGFEATSESAGIYCELS